MLPTAASSRFPEEKEYFAEVAAARKQDTVKAFDFSYGYISVPNP